MGWKINYSKILNPNNKTITVFGFLLMILLSYWFYNLSWGFMAPIIMVAPLLLCLFPIILIITYFIDKKFQTSLKKYSKTALLVLVLLLVLYLPIIILLDKLCDAEGDKLISKIKQYKIANDTLPPDLTNDYFNNVSKFNMLGKEFCYRKFYDDNLKDYSFYIDYDSFDGMTATKFEFGEKWVRDDD